MSRPPRSSPVFALACVALIWGLNFAIMKEPLERTPPALFNALRLTLSVAVLGLLHLAEKRRVKASAASGSRLAGGAPTPGAPRVAAPFGWWRVLGLGLIGHVAYQTAFIEGLARTTSGNAALLIATSPLWTALLARALGVERLGPRAWVGLGTALAGAIFLSFASRGASFGGHSLTGDLLVALAAVSWGAYTTGCRGALVRHTPTGLAFWTLLAALPGLWLLAAFSLDEAPPGWLDGPGWAALVYAGVLSTGLAYSLWNRGIERVGPSRTAVWANAAPVVALVNGSAFLGEPLGWIQGLGALLILGGILFLRGGEPGASEGVEPREGAG